MQLEASVKLKWNVYIHLFQFKKLKSRKQVKYCNLVWIWYLFSRIINCVLNSPLQKIALKSQVNSFFLKNKYAQFYQAHPIFQFFPNRNITRNYSVVHFAYWKSQDTYTVELMHIIYLCGPAQVKWYCTESEGRMEEKLDSSEQTPSKWLHAMMRCMSRKVVSGSSPVCIAVNCGS